MTFKDLSLAGGAGNLSYYWHRLHSRVRERQKGIQRSWLLAAAGVAGVVALTASWLTSGHASTLAVSLRWLALSLFALDGVATGRALTWWMLVALAGGVEFGHDLPSVAHHLDFLGAIFLRLVKVIVAPLIFATLVAGIGGHADAKRVGRLTLKSLLYFEVVSTLAMLIGFGAANLSCAGCDLHLASAIGSTSAPVAPHATLQLIVESFPENIVRALAEGQILQLVVFSMLFGVALALVPAAQRTAMVVFTESLSAVMFKFTSLVMLAAPVGVFGVIAYTVADRGTSAFLQLGWLGLTMYAALLVFVSCVLLPIGLLIGLPLKKFVSAVAEPVLIGFSTASSEAALPRAMDRLEKFGLRRDTIAFVLPFGYSFNLDGSSLYQSTALLFVAQASGVALTFNVQLAMFLTLLVMSKGIAGVSRASLLVVSSAAASFHLQPEAVVLLLGVDQFMDMGRTAMNVLGNCLSCAVIARWDDHGAREAAIQVALGD